MTRSDFLGNINPDRGRDNQVLTGGGFTKSRIIVWSLVSLLAFSGLLMAQTPLGRIAGVVLDKSGDAVAGATVTVISEATNQQQTTTASIAGAFIFPQLPAGSYKVTIEMRGFRSASYTKVKVDPGQEYSLTAALEVGLAIEATTIVADANLVNTTSTEISHTVTQRQVLGLPLNGRSPLELVRLQAGVAGIPR